MCSPVPSPRPALQHTVLPSVDTVAHIWDGEERTLTFPWKKFGVFGEAMGVTSLEIPHFSLAMVDDVLFIHVDLELFLD